MKAIQTVSRELRLIDIEDYITFLHLEKHHQIADIIDSATEQYFAPGFLSYREAGFVDIDWGKAGSVSLDLAMNTPKAIFEFTLLLTDLSAAVAMKDVRLTDDSGFSASAEDLLARAIETNRIMA